MWLNPPFPAVLVTFTEEIPNGKLHFLYSAVSDHFTVTGLNRNNQAYSTLFRFFVNL